jgi:micrococcal nuclease
MIALVCASSVALPLQPPGALTATAGVVARAAWLRVREAPLLAAASFAAGVAAGRLSTEYEQLATASDIPGKYIRQRKTLSARVVSVSDGDTIRVRHLPFPWPLAGPIPKGKLSETTIAVRLIAVDTPEIGKFGSSSQPFAEAARDFSAAEVLNTRVRVTCVQRDRYGRLVARVRYGPLARACLSANLLRRGLAVTYRGSDASYGAGGRDAWEALEERAKQRAEGMWCDGEEAVERPSEYKARTRE